MQTNSQNQPSSEPRASLFTVEQENELRRLKAYFPFRIVWGVVDENGNFTCGASTTRRELNRLLRKPGSIGATIG